MIDRELLNLLVCPSCRASLHYDRIKQELICRPERLAYPIQADIPVMLTSAARKLSLEEYEALL